MKSRILSYILFLFFLLTGTWVNAQQVYSISGRVTDENQKPVNGATIFIDGTQLVTLTNAGGKYDITIPHAGSYHLLVKMLGYNTIGRDVRITNQSAELNFNLSVKSVVLQSVNIGGDNAWANNLAIFKKEFLGTTDNANSCEIINPKIIYFSTAKNMLYASADDFLIIENKRLGYRIKYLLKTFEHSTTAHTAYNGDVVFEELSGTDQQKQKWANNRLEAYKGSMMHFLRAIFTNTTLQEGFVTNEMYTGGGNNYYNQTPAKIEEMVTAIDTSFIYFNFKGLRVLYDPAKAAKALKRHSTAANQEGLPVKNGTNESQLILYLKDPVIIDSRGAVSSGYLLSFLIRGGWTYKRVGDQLPFEYQPPPTTIPSP